MTMYAELKKLPDEERRQATLEYIVSMLVELGELASAAGDRSTARIIEMAALEAQESLQGGPVPAPNATLTDQPH